MVISISAFSQINYWQQKADYKMSIDFDSDKHRFKGEQTIVYTNNSPDILDKAFYHLYFNAFQPGSMMDIRSLTIPDPFEGQVPLQVRRSGRDSKEGIDYSMSQWYPKLSEYDHQGWHANPYVAREFHGVWGDFDVKITMDRKYTIGASGVLQNAKEIGKGYSDGKGTDQSDRLEWHFLAENVHDFVWGADPDYKHTKMEAYDGTMMHFLYQPGERTTDNWTNLPKAMDEALRYLNGRFGKYPYPVYSFIQGGDGGMEYPMATLITGERSFGSLVGVSVHEWMHSWFQMVLGTNESLYPWMDEGFTSFGSAETMNHLRKKGFINGEVTSNPMAQSIRGFESNHAGSTRDEPVSTHADHFDTNRSYSIGAYTKGSIFLEQLQYIIGKKDFASGMLKYYDQWKFKHPTPNDFIRVMEKESGLELDWYKEYMVNTIKYPDYAIDTAYDNTLVLHQYGTMPMPVEVVVTTKKGKKETYYIPLRIMRGEKENDWSKDDNVSLMEDWPWTHPTYDLELDCPVDKIEKIEINPTVNFLDLDRSNNVWPRVITERTSDK